MKMYNTPDTRKRHLLITSPLLLVASLLPLHSVAAETENCAQIENARERLACFDRAYPRDPNKPALLPQIIEQPIRTAPATPGVPAQAPAPAAAGTPPAPNPDTGNAPAQQGNAADQAPIRNGGGAAKSKSMFDRGEKIDFAATVEAVLSKEKQKMVFRLDNEQIWIQDSPRPLPIKKGTKVRITSGLVGGYLMRTEGGTSTRVHRIK